MTRLDISGLGHLGDGIAQGEWGPVFVPFALPGETVEAHLAEDGRAAILDKVVNPSPDRVTPRCPRFTQCGGCTQQHLRWEAYLAWKRELVVDALRTQGLDAEVRPVLPAEPQSRRRLGLTAVRTKSGVAIGLNARASHAVTDISVCLIARPALVEALPALGELAAPLLSRRGRLSLMVSETDTGLDIAIEGAKPLAGDTALILNRIARQGGFARVSVGGEVLAELRKPTISFDGLAVTLPPGGFLQATKAGEDALGEAVTSALSGGKKTADLFAGCGTFTGRLARFAAVHAVEGEAAAMSALDHAVRHQGSELRLKPVTTERRDLFKRPLLAKELDRFDGLLFDPPRAGADAQAREIARSNVPRVVAVSCNPATLARDLGTLVEGGYRVGPIQPVDQFLWSPHIECVVALEKEGRTRR